MDQNEKAHHRMVSRNYEIPNQIYGLSIIVDFFFGEVRHLSGRVEITLGECIWRVTPPNGECYKNIAFNTA